MNMAESSSNDYEEILLRDIEDSQVKCVLVLEHFTFEKAQVCHLQILVPSKSTI